MSATIDDEDSYVHGGKLKEPCEGDLELHDANSKSARDENCSVGSLNCPLTSCSNTCGVEASLDQTDDQSSQFACEFGCGLKLPHGELQFHYRNDIPMHLLMLFKKVETILSKVEALEEKVKHLEDRYQTSDVRHHGVQESGAARKDVNRGISIPDVLNKIFTKKSPLVCGTCHKELRYSSVENLKSVGTVNCERYALDVVDDHYHIYLSYSCAEKLQKSDKDRKCQICRALFKITNNDVAQAGLSVCPR